MHLLIMLKLLTRRLFILKFRKYIYLGIRPLQPKFWVVVILLLVLVILLFLVEHFRGTFPKIKRIIICILKTYIVFSLNFFLLLHRLLFLKVIGFEYLEKLFLIYSILHLKVIVTAYPVIHSCLSLGIVFIFSTYRTNAF